MPDELTLIGALLALLVSASTLIGIAVKSGERRAELNTVKDEVERLRTRQHDSSNAFSGVQVSVGELGVKVDNLTKAIEKLDMKMERHTEKSNGD